jgi:subtilase family serine protease
MQVKFFSSILLFGLIAVGSAGAAQATGSAVGQVIANNTPKFAAAAKNMGPENPSSTIEVSIWLNVHNRGELDSIAQELYDPQSPNFRHWLAKSDFVARYAPTAAEAKTVQEFFTSHNLAVVGVGPDNFFVRARGTVANVQKAFHVSINKFAVEGKTYRGNTSDPIVEGAAGRLAGAVYGLDNLEFKHHLVSRSTGLKLPKTPPTGPRTLLGAGDPEGISSNCFPGVRTEVFSSGGSYPFATYKGNGYTDAEAGCGYAPADIRTAYNLNALYKEGYDGTGQTIVILDWCGSPTILKDANAFSARFGLPALTSSTFSIINYPAPSGCEAPDPEINIDVEWAHAIAPGAAITLLVPPTAEFIDIDSAWLYAITGPDGTPLGNVLSGSYGAEELYVAPSFLLTQAFIAEVGAVLGVASNFSSGDEGDYTFDYPQYNPPSVSSPADAPYATAVGGVSLALKSNSTIAFQTGWGTNINELAFPGYVEDPPSNSAFFDFGSGGGTSGFFGKPAFQKHLPGNKRLLPDVSWLADPYTGGIIAISEPFTSPEIQYQVYGGTSLACPMFSALWAIANQEAGYPLGQAAPYLYSLPAGAIFDVVPYSSATNVTGTIVESETVTDYYTAAQLAEPLEGTTKFVSALWDYPLEPGFTLLLTFGTDSGLKTAVGWDNVTGVGTPNGKVFADHFK